jgi:hypothetical protein
MEVDIGRAFIVRAVEECITSDHDGSAFDPGRDVTKPSSARYSENPLFSRV